MALKHMVLIPVRTPEAVAMARAVKLLAAQAVQAVRLAAAKAARAKMAVRKLMRAITVGSHLLVTFSRSGALVPMY